MNAAMKAAWGLTAFVVLAGIVLWASTGRAVFAVFIVAGVLTGIGAFVTGRAAPGPTAAKNTPSAREDTP